MKYLSSLVKLIIVSFLFNSCNTSMVFNSSEKDAQIFVDGKPMGTGQTPIVRIKKDKCVNLKVEKTGFFTELAQVCYQGHTFGTPKTIFIQLNPDDAYNASTTNDYANKDFEVEVNPNLSEEEAWKILSQIVTNYFDNLEMADKSTGYLKTSWQTKSFAKKTIRTRIIVKQSGSDPLKYKLKIISEFSESPNQSVKNDDKFKEWDRIIRTYEDLITEFQARLGNK